LGAGDYLPAVEVTDDYYATLRVAPDAEDAVIRAAYRSLMRRYHPDVNPSVDAATRAKEINEAYACLRDASGRAAYDRRMKAEAGMVSPIRPAAPWPPHRPTFHADYADLLQSEPQLQPTWWKVAGLGLAAIITAVTFSVTSATPPPGPRVLDGPNVNGHLSPGVAHKG
jgi:hypothetical protein